MTYKEKIKYFYSEMNRRRGARKHAVPLLYRFFSNVGWKIRPPLFLHPVVFGIITGFLFGLFLGTSNWFLIHRKAAGHPRFEFVLAFSVGGIVFGALQAISHWNRTVKYRLPLWEDYPLDDID